MQKVSSENAPDLFVRINPSTTPTSTLSKVAPDPDGNKKNMAQTTQNNPVGTNIDLRHVYLNASENNPTQSNVVKTSTYSWWNFIPLFLFFQFKRPANVYFLTICILQVSFCFLFFVCLLPLTQEPRATIIALVCHLCSTPQFLVVFQFFSHACFVFFSLLKNLCGHLTTNKTQPPHFSCPIILGISYVDHYEGRPNNVSSLGIHSWSCCHQRDFGRYGET